MGHQSLKIFLFKSSFLLCSWITLMNFLSDFSGLCVASNANKEFKRVQMLSKQIIFHCRNLEQLCDGTRNKGDVLRLHQSWAINFTVQGLVENRQRCLQRSRSFPLRNYEVYSGGWERNWFLQGLDTYRKCTCSIAIEDYEGSRANIRQLVVAMISMFVLRRR